MKRKTADKQISQANRKAFAELLAACQRLKFEPHDIARHLDARGQYEIALDKDFPLHIQLFHVNPKRYTPIWNWHDRLEMTIPLDGPMCMRMGELRVQVTPGDLLVVDNLKLHNVEISPRLNTRAVVMSFMPEFVYSPGSVACDYAFLLPFYTKGEGQAHVLRASDELAAPIYQALAELLRRYFKSRNAHFQSGCKASFLEILYHLERRFHASAVLRSEFVQRRQLVDRFARLFDYIRINHAERITVKQAMKLAGMSQSQFMKMFKKVSGTTFVAHLTRVRINHAVRLLRQTDLSMAEIASTTGFPDQSYFDRRFKQATGKSPSQYRADLIKEIKTGTRVQGLPQRFPSRPRRSRGGRFRGNGNSRVTPPDSKIGFRARATSVGASPTRRVRAQS
jgi:AraC family transcriptional regulator, transcriptional activator of pobA